MRVLLFGAGQFGTVLYRLLDKKKYEVLGFIDNNKAGSLVEGLPVHEVSAIPRLNPDAILIAVQGEDRREAMCRQIADYGVRVEFPPMVDIRAAETALMAEQITRLGIPGAVAELGVYKGDSAVALNRLFKGRPLYLFDTFSGFAKEDIEAEEKTGGPAGSAGAKTGDFSDTDAEQVLSRMPYPEDVLIREGRFPETSRGLEACTFCFVNLDADLFEPVYHGLHFFYPRLNPGGFLLLHDARSNQFPGAGIALERFCKERGVYPIPLCDLHGSVILPKGGI